MTAVLTVLLATAGHAEAAPSKRAIARAFDSVSVQLGHVPVRTLSRSGSRRLRVALRRARRAWRRGRVCASLERLERVKSRVGSRSTWRRGRVPSRRARRIRRGIERVEGLLAGLRRARGCAARARRVKRINAKRVTGAPLPRQPPVSVKREPPEYPLRRGPFRPVTDIQQSTSLTAPAAANSARGAPGLRSNPNDPMTLFRNTGYGGAIRGGGGSELSLASAGNVVFVAGNGPYAAYSVDSGATFREIDIATVFPPFGGGICCDPTVTYVPRINRFVWIVEYWPETLNDCTGRGTPAQRSGRLRLAVASPQQLAASGGRAWTYWDLTPETFGLRGIGFDFSQVAFSDHSLHLSWLTTCTAGSLNFRVPLERLARGANLGGSPFLFAVIPGFLTAPATQNMDSREYFAQRISDSQIRSYYWDRGSPVIFWDDISHATVPAEGDGTSLNATGFDISDRGPPGIDIVTGTKTGNELWYAWTGFRDSRGRRVFPQPHIEIAIINATTNRLHEMRYIWNPEHTFRYPSLATNSDGEVGISFMWGGGGCAMCSPSNGRYSANAGVGLLTGRVELTATAIGAGNNVGGQDYTTIRTHFPDTELFSATSFVSEPAPGAGLPRYVLFGRGSGARPVPPRPDLVVSRVTHNTFSVRNDGAAPAGPFSISVTTPGASPLTFEADGLAPGGQLNRV
ncbi:MAG: hypothetical protein ACRDKY_04345, partial [Solirubrobacteraceae bacterium]